LGKKKTLVRQNEKGDEVTRATCGETRSKEKKEGQEKETPIQWELNIPAKFVKKVFPGQGAGKRHNMADK